MSERTLVLVKPDGVARGLVGEVLSRIEAKGFTLVALELRTLDRATAEEHYGEHKDKPFFGELVDFITSGPLLAAVIEDEFRLAEAEKYPHVTFFFNGGVEVPAPGEERQMAPSPKVRTYDLAPEMVGRLVGLLAQRDRVSVDAPLPD